MKTMSEGRKPIRLLVAEDSPACRDLLVTLFQNAPGVQVVGTARDGAEAVRLVRRLKPDVVTMDIYMPVMDGYEATRHIMAETPCPIVMVSGRLSTADASQTFNALQVGALSILPKPTLADSETQNQALIDQVKLMAGVKVVRRRWLDGLPQTGPIRPLPEPGQAGQNRVHMVAMAASTGGPAAVAAILRRLPPALPVPVLLVQHVARGFGEGLVAWLGKQTALTVCLAKPAHEPQPGVVYVAPDAYHLQMNAFGLLALKSPAPQDDYCPSADVLFASVAAVYGPTAVGIILTGMGDDGAQGLLALRQAGAHTIAQDKTSSVVFGMPAAAMQRGAVQDTLPIDQIAAALMNRIWEKP